MTKSDPDMSLLCLRATPVDLKLPSPAELLLELPIQDNLLRKIPRNPSNEEVNSRFTEREQVQKYCERFEPGSHFKSRLSLIVRVNVVLNRTVVVNGD